MDTKLILIFFGGLKMLSFESACADAIYVPVPAFELWKGNHQNERAKFAELICSKRDSKVVEAFAATTAMPDDARYAVWGRCVPHRTLDSHPIAWESKCDVSSAGEWTCDKHEVLFATIGDIPVRLGNQLPYAVRTEAEELSLDEGWRALYFVLSTQTLGDVSRSDWDEFDATMTCRSNQPCRECQAASLQGDVFIDCDSEDFRVRRDNRGRLGLVDTFPGSQ